DRLLADQRRRGEDQARLQEARERLRLAVAEAVLGVGRRGGVAHGEEGAERGDQVEAGVRQRGQDRDRAGGDPDRRLDRGQRQRRRDRQRRDPARQRGGLLGRELVGGGDHAPNLGAGGSIP